MISQTKNRHELDMLAKRRQTLQGKLKIHFCLPVSKRNYDELGLVVDELEKLRLRLHILKGGRDE